MQAKGKVLPFRESTNSSWFSSYRHFWRSSEWVPFLQPATGGFAVSRIAPQAHSCTNQLMDQPGVYEMALIRKGVETRYKVYVGQSSSIRRRFHKDYRGPTGSHLKPFFEEALSNGCEIWMRCRYMKTAEDALRKEAELLKKYDYAWNSRQAGCRARHVNIAVNQLCFSKSVHILSKPAQSIKESSSPLAQGLKHLPAQLSPTSHSLPNKLEPIMTSPLQVSATAFPFSPSPHNPTAKSWTRSPSLPRV